MTEPTDAPADVWSFGLDDTADGLGTALALSPPPGDPAGWLDDDERARAASALDATVRHRLLLSRVALRLVVGRALGRHPRDVRLGREPCPRCGGPHGRPVVVDGGDLHLSLSRSGGEALVALRRGLPVGVDVEQHVTGPRPLRGRPSGRGVVDDLPRWVRVEAALKATGEGLARDPDGVLLRSVGDGVATATEGTAVAVDVLDLPLGPRLAAAVAGVGLAAAGARVHLPVTDAT